MAQMVNFMSGVFHRDKKERRVHLPKSAGSHAESPFKATG